HLASKTGSDDADTYLFLHNCDFTDCSWKENQDEEYLRVFDIPIRAAACQIYRRPPLNAAAISLNTAAVLLKTAAILISMTAVLDIAATPFEHLSQYHLMWPRY